MAKTVYVVNGIEEVTSLKALASVLGVAKVTGKDIESGNYPNVEVKLVAEPGDVTVVVPEEPTDVSPEPVEDTEVVEVPEEATDALPADTDTVEPPTKDANGLTPKQFDSVLGIIGNVIEDNDGEDTLEVEQLYTDISDGNELSEYQHTVLTKVLNGTYEFPKAEVVTPPPAKVTPPPTKGKGKATVDAPEFPEVGYFKGDEKAMSKHIKKLSDAQLAEWCELEGATWKPNDHESINRMRMAMAIKAIHFPTEKTGNSSKKKAKYADYSLETLVQLAMDNDVAVPDDKGDERILRMYTIMALKKAGLIA
jgi:hypothetical protein